MSIEKKMDQIMEHLEKIEKGVLDMIQVMESMGEMIKAWHQDDITHHVEENNLIKQTFKGGENDGKG